MAYRHTTHRRTAKNGALQNLNGLILDSSHNQHNSITQHQLSLASTSMLADYKHFAIIVFCVNNCCLTCYDRESDKDALPERCCSNRALIAERAQPSTGQTCPPPCILFSSMTLVKWCNTVHSYSNSSTLRHKMELSNR